MSADIDKRILDGLMKSSEVWLSGFFDNKVNLALGLKEQFYEQDLPQLRRIRWYSIRDMVEAQGLWLRYVDNEELEGEAKQTMFDFYMNGSTFVWLNNPIPSGHYEGFIAHLAASLSWPSRASAIPAETREHVASSEQMAELMKNNHWLIFLMLISLGQFDQ
jgi:hypothetical protein